MITYTGESQKWDNPPYGLSHMRSPQTVELARTYLGFGFGDRWRACIHRQKFPRYEGFVEMVRLEI